MFHRLFGSCLSDPASLVSTSSSSSSQSNSSHSNTSRRISARSSTINAKKTTSKERERRIAELEQALRDNTVTRRVLHPVYPSHPYRDNDDNDEEKEEMFSDWDEKSTLWVALSLPVWRARLTGTLLLDPSSTSRGDEDNTDDSRGDQTTGHTLAYSDGETSPALHHHQQQPPEMGERSRPTA